MASALVALATTTLASSSATVTFSSLPTSGYRDLRLVVNGTAVSTDNTYIKFNGDSTAGNYSFVQAYGNGTSALSSSNSASFTSGALFTGLTTMTYDFMDYSATDKHKTTLLRLSAAGSGVDMWATRWANTAAITSIVIGLVGGGSIATGTTLSLYGVTA